MNLMKQFDDVLSSRWALWAISVAVAVSMWFYAIETSEVVNERRRFLIGIEYRNLDSPYVVRGAAQNVEVHVEAPLSVLNDLKPEAIFTEVDLRARSAGKYREPVVTRVPQNVTVVGVTPNVVDVEIIRQAGRVFPVEVVLPQDIPSGRYLEAVEVIPKELSVKGTERDLAKIGSVSIAPTVEELETGKELLLPVKITQSEPFEDDVALEPAQVRMHATLVTGQPRKKVPVNVRLSGKPSQDYAVRSVTTDPAEIMVQGPNQKLSSISAADTETVDITDITADQTLVVPLRPFQDKSVSTMEVNSVRLLVQLEPIMAQKQLSGLPVTIQGGDAAKWAVTPAAVDVVLEVPPSQLEASGGVDVKVFVDVSNIFSRKVTLPVRAETASGDFKIVNTNPPTVTATAVE